MKPAIIQITLADLANPQHARSVVELIDDYARDIMGGGVGLSDDVRSVLVSRLAEHPGCRVFLAYREGLAVGVAVCFTGFSTFAARPLINIHDLAVHADHRGQGIGRALLAAVEEYARTHDCCKLSLEVRADNAVARGLYESFGFEKSDTPANSYSFLSKRL